MNLLGTCAPFYCPFQEVSQKSRGKKEKREMKIQCDACNKDEALLFCTADDAALCEACDHRVHRANILASKHHRFPLLHPSNDHFPLCDICQERRAFLFCQQDRAILCRDCDLPIHAVNELTQKHDRFLLTGIKLSCVSALNAASSSSEASFAFNSDPNSQPLFEKTANASAPVSHSPSLAESSMSNVPVAAASADGGDPTDTVSEYLIETIPGWNLEEFLDSSSAPFGFYKLQSDDGDWVFPFLDDLVELETSRDSLASVPLFCTEVSWEIELNERNGGGNEKARGGGGGGGRWSRRDDGFTVPEICVWSRRYRSS
ncbi:B-box zinc finger protein 20-like [Momordica charantia]|uniref:B-box zinc finger protein 20-like n=1 Tax=Momordica charantia TaxID=3673 RepID=A0A6J1C6M2_MOMCH|nr:B-box zinc finger protein 20-like [Momordica charantia]XP_022136156.1 B-box zinc finger protein 20-like [Momordica charantia]